MEAWRAASLPSALARAGVQLRALARRLLPRRARARPVGRGAVGGGVPQGDEAGLELDDDGRHVVAAGAVAHGVGGQAVLEQLGGRCHGHTGHHEIWRKQVIRNPRRNLKYAKVPYKKTF